MIFEAKNWLEKENLKLAPQAPEGGIAGQSDVLGATQERAMPNFANEAARKRVKLLAQAQPALGGLRPSDLLDTETGTQMVHQLLGALESGAYL